MKNKKNQRKSRKEEIRPIWGRRKIWSEEKIEALRLYIEVLPQNTAGKKLNKKEDLDFILSIRWINQLSLLYKLYLYTFCKVTNCLIIQIYYNSERTNMIRMRQAISILIKNV